MHRMAIIQTRMKEATFPPFALAMMEMKVRAKYLTGSWV